MRQQCSNALKHTLDPMKQFKVAGRGEVLMCQEPKIFSDEECKTGTGSKIWNMGILTLEHEEKYLYWNGGMQR